LNEGGVAFIPGLPGLISRVISMADPDGWKGVSQRMEGVIIPLF
jgi:hypothetical protein